MPKYMHYSGCKSFQDFFGFFIKKCHHDKFILRNELLDWYFDYCEHEGVAAASPVNIGRTLSRMGIRADRRVGGHNGLDQQYAYSGLAWRDCPPDYCPEVIIEEGEENIDPLLLTYCYVPLMRLREGSRDVAME
ncbi:hypothetical protein OTU49_013234 [Cherax quadricarinatus]|uniref:Uncharacterized protein n=1 Tax=Cherax quadricarinatus TaxID=27406 RepID=A0AAW0VUF1_CHEQU